MTIQKQEHLTLLSTAACFAGGGTLAVLFFPYPSPFRGPLIMMTHPFG